MHGSLLLQVPWEEEVIWNGEDVRQKVLGNQKQSGARAGWIPSSNCRTAQQYFAHGECKTSLSPDHQLTIIVSVRSAGKTTSCYTLCECRSSQEFAFQRAVEAR